MLNISETLNVESFVHVIVWKRKLPSDSRHDCPRTIIRTGLTSSLTRAEEDMAIVIAVWSSVRCGTIASHARNVCCEDREGAAERTTGEDS